MIEMKKDIKKVDNWLYLIKKRAERESTKNKDNNQRMGST
jgi:hypothetical protein